MFFMSLPVILKIFPVHIFCAQKKWFYVYNNKREPLRVDVIQVRKILVDRCATKEAIFMKKKMAIFLV